jgi:hypothetical protein
MSSGVIFRAFLLRDGGGYDIVPKIAAEFAGREFELHAAQLKQAGNMAGIELYKKSISLSSLKRSVRIEPNRESRRIQRNGDDVFCGIRFRPAARP